MLPRSATGQLFIFYTIKKFGPIVFTIMMTTRQMLSLTISCFVFGHALGPGAILGTTVRFGAAEATLGAEASDPPSRTRGGHS